MAEYLLKWGKHRLPLGRRTLVMGVVNVTPDSFSDGGRYLSTDHAISHGLRLRDEGADILDIGGESTRPFSEGISEEEEARRVLPVIEALAKQVQVPISIDTTKAGIAKRALSAGASMVNDIGALRLDPELGTVVAQAGVPIVLMHMLGTPRTMQADPHYDDVIGEIGGFLQEAVARASAAGISRSNIIIDPGIGFGKTFGHNFLLLKHLAKLAYLDLPVLVGPSRKAFIRHTLKDPSEDDIPADAPVVEIGTQAAVCAAALNGAHIVRVHDVARTRAALKIVDAVRFAGENE